MSALSRRAAARPATAMAMAVGLTICLSAGTATASPTDGVADRLGTGKDRVILQAPSSAGTAALSLSAKAPRLVGGAAVRVTANYNCPSGARGYLEVQLAEVTGKVVAQGYGSNVRPLICDGTAHNMNVSVIVQSDYPFRKGEGFSRGFLYAFSEPVGTEPVETTAATERAITIT